MIRILSIAIFASTLSIAAFASAPQKADKASVKDKPTSAQKAKSEHFTLYKSPNKKAKALKTYAANTDLVPIFQNKQKPNWVKVGDPNTGDVGWVNKKQWRKAYDNFNRPDIQTVFVDASQNDSGKPSINVIAYKNGKKLNEKNAQALYHKIRKEHNFQREQMQRSIEQDFRQTQMMMPGAFNMNRVNNFPMHNFNGFGFAQPIIVIEQPQTLPARHGAHKKADRYKSLNKDTHGSI